MPDPSSDPAFTRRKFTLPESLDAVLEEIAEENYQGNVSLCLRAAIEDHRKTISGSDSELMTQRIVNQVDELIDHQNRVLDTINTIERQLEQQREQSGPSKFDIDELSERAEQICLELETADSGLRVDSIAERLDLPTSRVQPVLSRLLDYGLVTARGTAPSRYYLLGLEERS